MFQKLLGFYQRYLRNADKIMLGLLAIAAIIGITYIISNAIGHQYPGNQFVSWRLFIGLPFMIALYSTALFAQQTSPRIGFITWTYTNYFFMLLCLGTLAYGVQFTPFHPIDSALIKIDQVLGFSQTTLLNWTYIHHSLAILLNQAYSLIGIELSFIPLILAFLLDRRAVKVLFIAIIFSFIVGTTIYYFLPTTAPASMFLNSNFAQQQHDTWIKFFEIHHHLLITTQEGGLIAFPSFHVIWCILLAYALKRKKIIFYPIVLLNTFIIASTVLLGWHYLVDVVGGFAVAILAIWIAETIYKKYIIKERIPTT